MIGHFSYHPHGAPNHVLVEMCWRPTGEAARVLAPAWVVERLAEFDVGVRREDELMSLHLAMSYAVLLAALSNAPLCLSGDKSVWPERWGKLLEGSAAPIFSARFPKGAVPPLPYGPD